MNLLSRFKSNSEKFGICSISLRKIQKPYYLPEDKFYALKGYKHIRGCFGTDFYSSFAERCMLENDSMCNTGYNFGSWSLEDDSYVITLVYRDFKYQFYILKK